VHAATLEWCRLYFFDIVGERIFQFPPIRLLSAHALAMPVAHLKHVRLLCLVVPLARVVLVCADTALAPVICRTVARIIVIGMHLVFVRPLLAHVAVPIHLLGAYIALAGGAAVVSERV
jgi:hypothetical protein